MRRAGVSRRDVWAVRRVANEDASETAASGQIGADSVEWALVPTPATVHFCSPLAASHPLIISPRVSTHNPIAPQSLSHSVLAAAGHSGDTFAANWLGDCRR